MSKKIIRLIGGLLTLVLFLGFFVTGYYFGQNKIRIINLPDSLQNISTKPGITKLLNATEPQGVDFSLLWEAWQTIDDQYIGEKDSGKRVEGAIAGMVDSLDDPYTVYLEPSANELFLSSLDGEFSGIGAELAIRDSQITVVAPLEGSPAEKAGLKPKDIILKIDNEEIGKMTFNEAILKVRGEKGTIVKLTVFREGNNEELEITITRDIIKVDSVKLSFVGPDNSIALLKVNQFGRDTLDLLKASAKTIKEKNSKGVIVDLRNNPGGLLEVVVEMTGLFLPDNLDDQTDANLRKGIVVLEEEKNGNKNEFKRVGKQIFDQPLVIVQNNGSASASEIFAGALKDYKRAQIIGETSFGKGSVQNLVELSNKGSIKVTIARWLTPKGSQINGKGIDPDIKIEEEVVDSHDPFINKAVEILNN